MCSRGLLSDQYISEEKFFVDCYKAVMGNARPGTQHSTKGYDRYRLYKLCSSGSWFELYRQTVFFQAMRKEHLAAVPISIEACRRGSGGRAAVTVSAVWLRDLS